jgi:hypothetical protein
VACRQCGAEMASDADRCDACGSPADGAVRAGDADVAVAGAAPAAAPRTITFTLSRLTRGDRIAGVASAVVFIALLLPWYGTGLIGITVDGLWHGWMYLTLLLSIATVGYLVARAAVEVRLPVVHWQVLLGATGAMLLLVVVGLVTTPSGATLQWGAIVGVIAAAAAFAGAMLGRREAAPA